MSEMKRYKISYIFIRKLIKISKIRCTIIIECLGLRYYYSLHFMSDNIHVKICETRKILLSENIKKYAKILVNIRKY